MKKARYFYFNEDDEQITEMEIEISGNDLTFYHTEVLPKSEGKGLVKNAKCHGYDARKMD